MKKIAFIIELLGTTRHGGEQFAMIRVSDSLKKRGYNVDNYSYNSSDKELKIDSIYPSSIRLLPYLRDIFVMPIVGKNLLKRIDSKYSVIFASATTIAARYKPKCDLIIVCHMIRSQRFENLSKIPKYKPLFNSVSYKIISELEKKSFGNASMIIVLRKRQKDFLINKLGLKSEKIKIIPNGIDTDFFRPIKVAKKNQIIFSGRGTLIKGLDVLLQASDKINASVLIATHRINDDLLKLALTKKNITIVRNSTQKDLVRLYCESQLLVLPSRDEEQPLTTLEAMACGLPVVVTKEGGADIVKDKINGYIIPINNSKELASKVNILLANKKFSNNLSKINRKHIEKKFSLKKITNQFSTIITS